MFTLARVLLIATVLLTLFTVGLFLYSLPVVLVLLVAGAVWSRLHERRQSDAYGSARWAQPADIPHMLDGHGLILGHMSGRMNKLMGVRSLLSPRVPSRLACQRLLMACGLAGSKPVVRLTKSVHISVCAPTGVGKGVSCIIPHLLTCTDSMVCLDFKGELTTLTAQARRAMGHRVVVIDPYKQSTQTPDTFNPVEYIDRESPTMLDDCRDLAEALVIRSGDEKDPHWADSAELWIGAMIAIVVMFGEGHEKSLQSVRSLLTNPDKMALAIKLMCESSAMNGMLSRLGQQLTHFKDKELASTLTTVNRYLRFLDTPAIADSTIKSSFDPAELLNGKTTVYLVLPPDRMRAQSALLRLWIGSLLRAVVKGGLQEGTKVHFVLDEAASLGHMPAISDAIDKYRGYGVRLLFFWQSLGQLRTSFPDGQDQTFLSNVTQVFFGVNDQPTAEYVSSRLGESTMVVESGGTSHSVSTQGGPNQHERSISRSSNDNWQFMGRRLLKPEEVTALPDRVAITFAPGVPPIATRLIRYYERDFKKIKGIGPIATAARAVFVFILVLALVVMVTAAISSPSAHERNHHDQARPAAVRAHAGRPAVHPR